MISTSLEEEKTSGKSKYFKDLNDGNMSGPQMRMKFSPILSIPVTNPVLVHGLRRLGMDFFDQECRELAKKLLGKIFVRQFPDGSKMWGKIVETEAYLGGEDKASHSYGNKRTQRNAPMFMEPGTVYVYSIYGMYYCVNVSSKGEGAAVLIRAIEPLGGLRLMEKLRRGNKKTQKILNAHQLCNGPSKICLSFGIDRQLNADHLTSSQSIWIEESDSHEEINVVISSRIGMSKKSEEWATAPLRYYVLNSPSVSIIDRNRENQMRSNPC